MSAALRASMRSLPTRRRGLRMEASVASERRTKRIREHERVKSIAHRLTALGEMSPTELREQYLAVFGEPTRTRNRKWLLKKIAWRIQADAEGGLTARARERADELGATAPVRWNRPPEHERPEPERDPRLPLPGTVLRRTYRDVTHEVTVLREGFEYAGREFKSLSAVALEITGTVWNGLLFFGLKKRKAAAS